MQGVAGQHDCPRVTRFNLEEPVVAGRSDRRGARPLHRAVAARLVQLRRVGDRARREQHRRGRVGALARADAAGRDPPAERALERPARIALHQIARCRADLAAGVGAHRRGAAGSAAGSGSGSGAARAHRRQQPVEPVALAPDGQPRGAERSRHQHREQPRERERNQPDAARRPHRVDGRHGQEPDTQRQRDHPQLGQPVRADPLLERQQQHDGRRNQADEQPARIDPDPALVALAAKRVDQQEPQDPAHRHAPHQPPDPAVRPLPRHHDLGEIRGEDHEVDADQRCQDVLGEDLEGAGIGQAVIVPGHVAGQRGEEDPGIAEQRDDDPEPKVDLRLDVHAEQLVQRAQGYREPDEEHRREDGGPEEGEQELSVVVPEGRGLRSANEGQHRNEEVQRSAQLDIAQHLPLVARARP